MSYFIGTLQVPAPIPLPYRPYSPPIGIGKLLYKNNICIQIGPV